MSNYEWITGMGPGELAAFLRLIEFDGPWHDAFAKQFCASCPSKLVFQEGLREPVEVYPCDYTDHQCRHGDVLTWWLSQEVER